MEISSLRLFLISKNKSNVNCMKFKNAIFECLGENCFTLGRCNKNLRTLHLRRFKESFLLKLLTFLKDFKLKKFK